MGRGNGRCDTRRVGCVEKSRDRTWIKPRLTAVAWSGKQRGAGGGDGLADLLSGSGTAEGGSMGRLSREMGGTFQITTWW